eukprot:TRINITY_DN40320_c0_g1_i1.p1 TRINITY_DN40320_c0_g1~~TRINITY_DN40320_c0_g1_i1.p1  ORF type:complete len:346 (+),score=18.46 TRINITY_DN40320_c0_g1_i1:82-1119(+)
MLVWITPIWLVLPVLACDRFCSHCNVDDGVCMACSDGHHLELGTCTSSCDESCLSCDGPAKDDCTECSDHLFVDESGSCQLCHPSCLRCNGATASDCSACVEHHFLDGLMVGECVVHYENLHYFGKLRVVGLQWCFLIASVVLCVCCRNFPRRLQIVLLLTLAFSFTQLRLDKTDWVWPCFHVLPFLCICVLCGMWRKSAPLSSSPLQAAGVPFLGVRSVCVPFFVFKASARRFYHGTSLANASSIDRDGFRRSANGMLGPGVYVSSDIAKARCYGGQNNVVFELRVDLGKVKKIDYQGHPLQYTWPQHGYDSAWVPPNNTMVGSGRSETCVWDPRRIAIVRRVQ